MSVATVAHPGLRWQGGASPGDWTVTNHSLSPDPFANLECFPLDDRGAAIARFEELGRFEEAELGATAGD